MIVWMDGIVFKVRENGKVINKTVYLGVGLNKEGLKEVLGMWVGKNLYQYGVSVVNVGSTAYKRYVSIFKRKDGKSFEL